MKTLAITLAVSSALLTTSAFAMSKSEYKAEQDRIDTSYKTATQRCKSFSGNAHDVCEAQADGDRKVARADLEARHEPSDKAAYEARVARADATFDVAKERCDDYAGNAKDVCRKDADAKHERAVADARVSREAARADLRVADERAHADRDAADAAYKAARERCDAYAGAARDRCITDAKNRYAQ
jgi:hypothetical protein